VLVEHFSIFVVFPLICVLYSPSLDASLYGLHQLEMVMTIFWAMSFADGD